MISDWTKKYEPKNIDDVVLIDRIRKVVNKWINAGDISQNILLAGTPGFGKTSLGEVLRRHFNIEDSVYYNAGDINIDELRTNLNSFLMKTGFSGKRKIVFIDEFDLIPDKALDYLKSMMWQYQKNTLFIAATNNKHKLTEAILSRFGCQINLVPETEDERKEHKQNFFKRLLHILRQENVLDDKVTKKASQQEKNVLAEIVKKNYPDFRKIIGVVQLAYNQFDCIDERALVTSTGLNDKLIVAMKNKNLEEVMKLLKYINVNNFFTDFYNKISDLVDVSCWKDVLQIIGDYQSRTGRDDELNTACCINELINTPNLLKWKD